MTQEGETRSIKILLVDDIAEAREGVKKLLAFESDFSVVGGAANGRDAVAQAKELKPDIVIMDINMPDMDGLEAANRITKALPMVGVIMMSVQDDPDYMQRAMMAGARSFISKPPTMDQLYGTIRTVYQQYEPIRRQMDALSHQRYVPTDDDEADDGTGNRDGHIIVVYSPQGGAGCTTIATSIASGLMKDGVKTLLVDGNYQFGDVGAFLNVNAQSNILDLVQNVGDLDLEYSDSIISTHNSGMKVLLGPSRPSDGLDVRDNQPDAMAKVVQQIANFYDFVVIDTGSSIDVITAAWLEMAEKIVLVMNPTLPSIKNARLILDLFDQSEFPPEKTAVVVNKAIENPSRQQKEYPTPEKIQNYLRRPIEGVIPLVEETFILRAINKGVPVIAADRDTNKPPIKQLLKLSNHLYASIRGEEEQEEGEEAKEKRSWTLFGNR